MSLAIVLATLVIVLFWALGKLMIKNSKNSDDQEAHVEDKKLCPKKVVENGKTASPKTGLSIQIRST